MNDVLHDLRYGARMLVRHPATTAAVVATLALGIGVATAMFSVVHRVLVEPLPYADPDRLVLVRHDIPRLGMTAAPLPPADVADLQALEGVFEGAAATDRTSPMNLTGAGPPEVVRVARVSPNFFDVLGVKPAIGRGFRPADGAPVASDTVYGARVTGAVVVSHELWQRRFGGDTAIVEGGLVLNGDSVPVLGVLPPEFRLHMPADAGMSTDIDVWSVTRFDYRSLPRTSTYANRRVIARRAPGVSLTDARRALDDLAADLRRTHEYHRQGEIAFTVTSLRAAIVGQARPLLIGLFVAVGIVLLAACANVANLLLVRGVAREREIAIRAAVGGARGRLFRQLLTETMILAAAGGAIGLLVAWWGIDLLLAFRPPDLPRFGTVPMDATVLAFSGGLTILVALVAGSVPALHAARSNLHRSLNDRGLRGQDRARHRLQGWMVGGEIALAVTLLVAAGLMSLGLRELERTDLGFEPASVVAFQVSLPVSDYPTLDDRADFHARFASSAAGLDEVEIVGATNVLPLGGQFWTTPWRTTPNGAVQEANLQVVTPGTFDALGVRVVAGRGFRSEDEAGRAMVAVVDRGLARQAWPEGEAVGRRLWIDGVDGGTGEYEIVGVTEPVRVERPGAPTNGTLFLPYATEGAYPTMTLLVRTAGDRGPGVADRLQRALRSLDPNVPAGRMVALDDVVRRAVAAPRFATLLVGLFAVVVLALAAVGIWGVASSVVRQRTPEIGLRLALGAPEGRIVRAVLGRGLRLGAIGMAAGLTVSFVVAPPAVAWITGIEITASGVYVAVAALLLCVTGLASFLPARRAVNVNPTDALRYE